MDDLPDPLHRRVPARVGQQVGSVKGQPLRGRVALQSGAYLVSAGEVANGGADRAARRQQLDEHETGQVT